jgi:hypothetical protein
VRMLLLRLGSKWDEELGRGGWVGFSRDSSGYPLLNVLFVADFFGYIERLGCSRIHVGLCVHIKSLNS